MAVPGIMTSTIALFLSSIVNVPGEWTLRREFLRLQTEDHQGGREGGHGGGGGQQRHQVGLLCTTFHINIHSYFGNYNTVMSGGSVVEHWVCMQKATGLNPTPGSLPNGTRQEKKQTC